MRKATMHYILDAIEGVILLALVVSGFILWVALPEGSEVGKTFLLDRQTWVQIHRWLAVSLLVFFIDRLCFEPVLCAVRFVCDNHNIPAF